MFEVKNLIKKGNIKEILNDDTLSAMNNLSSPAQTFILSQFKPVTKSKKNVSDGPMKRYLYASQYLNQLPEGTDCCQEFLIYLRSEHCNVHQIQLQLMLV